MTTYYYAAAQTTASGVSRPTRIPGMDGPQRSTIAEAVRDYGAGYEWQVRAMDDGYDRAITDDEAEAAGVQI